MRYYTNRFSDVEIARLRAQAHPVEAATIDMAREKLERISNRRRDLSNQIRDAVNDIIRDIASHTVPTDAFSVRHDGFGDANSYGYNIGKDIDKTQIYLDYSPEYVFDADGLNARKVRKLKIQLPGYGYLRAEDTNKVQAAILFGVIAGQINTLQQTFAELPFGLYDAACEEEVRARELLEKGANAVKTRMDNQRHAVYRSRTVVGLELAVDTTPPLSHRRVFSPGKVTRVTEKCVFVTMKPNGKTKRYTWDDYFTAFDDRKLYFDGEEVKEVK